MYVFAGDGEGDESSRKPSNKLRKVRLSIQAHMLPSPTHVAIVYVM